MWQEWDQLVGGGNWTVAVIGMVTLKNPPTAIQGGCWTLVAISYHVHTTCESGCMCGGISSFQDSESGILYVPNVFTSLSWCQPTGPRSRTGPCTFLSSLGEARWVNFHFDQSDIHFGKEKHVVIYGCTYVVNTVTSRTRLLLNWLLYNDWIEVSYPCFSPRTCLAKALTGITSTFSPGMAESDSRPGPSSRSQQWTAWTWCLDAWNELTDLWLSYLTFPFFNPWRTRGV